MTHLQKALWAAVTTVLFFVIGTGLMITEGLTAPATPSVVASYVITAVLCGYAGHEMRAHLDEQRHTPPEDAEDWEQYQP